MLNEDFWNKLKEHNYHVSADYVITIMRNLNEMGYLNEAGKKRLADLITQESYNRK